MPPVGVRRPSHSDTQEAISESLGYLDASAADVLQWAVLADLVYG